MNEERQRPRIRISLPVEGVVFLVILVFVTICAVVRNVGMLVIFSGVMSISWMLCWRMTRQSVRQIVVRRVPSYQVHAGQPVAIHWEATNHGTIDVLQLSLTDTIQPIAPHPVPPSGRRQRKMQIDIGRLTLERVPARDKTSSSYPVVFAQRGQYKIGPAIVASSFPLSLVKCWFRTNQVDTVYVAPALGQLQSDWNAFWADALQRSEAQGRAMAFQNEEFFALRTWRSGDSRRNIHWRSTAKHRQPMVKQFDRFVDRDLILILDLFAESAGSSRLPKANALAKVETMISFAATLLTQWVHSPAGNLLVAVAGERLEIFVSSQQRDFTTRLMRGLSMARYGNGSCLPHAIQQALEMGAAQAPCWIVSSRDQSEMDIKMDPSQGARIRFWRSDEGRIDNLFEVSKQSLWETQLAMFDNLPKRE